MSNRFSGFDAEISLSDLSTGRVSGSWVEVAQVQQKDAKISGTWVEVAQVQQKEMKLSANWAEVVYLVGIPPEPVYVPPVEIPKHRRLILGMSAMPILVDDPIVPPEAPDAVVLTVEAISTTQLQLIFANTTGAYYVYRINGGEPLLLGFDKKINNLTANTQYLIEVRAVTQGGPGPWSNAVLATTWQTVGSDTPVITPPPVDPPPAQGTLGSAVAGSQNFFGYTYSDSYGVAKVVVAEEFISYNGINGTAPYTYSWALLGNATLTPDNISLEILPANNPGQYALPYLLNGGTTQFWALVPAGYTLEHSLRCTITDSLGATCYFDRHVQLIHYNIAPPPLMIAPGGLGYGGLGGGFGFGFFEYQNSYVENQ